MGDINLFDSHEKNEAWTKLFFLTEKRGNSFLYYKGLKKAERLELIAFFQDILEDSRSNIIGDRFGQPDTSHTERGNEETIRVSRVSIHDPKSYSFGKNVKWIPWADDATSGAKRGRYAGRYPRGLVLHWTAGHRNGLKSGNSLMRNTGMLYLLGDKNGNLAQSDSLEWHGYHAGKSSHRFASGYVSDEYIGLELQAAGMLTKRSGGFHSWFNTKIPDNQVVSSERRENIAKGFYHLYTEKQMLLTRRLVCWLYLNNPDVFSIDRVVGHDEVSPGRKVDPGASTFDIQSKETLTMAGLRRQCWNDVDMISELRKNAA